jgi:Lipoprotein LpqB beta-propeller domain/Sporulation and spore germination
MVSPRWRPARRRGWLACGTTAIALSVAGCVSMPASGPASSLPVNQSGVGQSQAYDGPVPSPPKPGWQPQQIVQGFLFASASYYTAGATARAYLTPQASQAWKPGGSVTVSQTWNVPTPDVSSSRHVKQVTVTVSGQVQVTLNGSGQQLYASAGAGAQAAPANGCAQPDGEYPFTLVNQNGEWRISHAPSCLLVDKDDFQRFWESQDLYFFDSARQILVPDSVFVPIGTSETDLLNKLTDALEAGPPAWLSHGVTASVFPSAKINVTVIGDTAIVNMEGHINLNQQSLAEISAQLVWTLTSASVGQPAIQSVDLDINGSQVFPLGSQIQLSKAQFESYDPYPSAKASLSYVDGNGVAQTACGWTRDPGIGPAVPVFTHGVAAALASCGATPATATPPSPTTSAATHPADLGHDGGTKAGNSTGTYSMAAVSSDGKYVAVVSADRDQVSIGSVGTNSAPKPVSLPKGTITSISWDRQYSQDNLWLTQGGNVWMVTPGGKPVEVTYSGDVTALSVAPDGVRAALIVQGGGLELAAINPDGSATGQPTPHGSEVGGPTIGTPVPLGPGIANAGALTWYDADDLIVLDQVGASSQLEEVPVDGRAAIQFLAPLQTPTGVTVESVAAGNAQNVVVVGLSNQQLEVSAGFEGPWEDVRTGSEPAYWIPLPAKNSN